MLIHVVKRALEEKAATFCSPLLAVCELCHEGAVVLEVYLSPHSPVTCESSFPG